MVRRQHRHLTITKIPSGTKAEQVSIVVGGRKGMLETFHDTAFCCFGPRNVRRYPEFISTQLTLNGVKGEIAFWGHYIPPELRNLTAK